MKIKIFKKGEALPIFEGEYEYVEGGRTNGKPSFHFAMHNSKGDFCEVEFYAENDEEFYEMLESLKEQVEGAEEFKSEN